MSKKRILLAIFVIALLVVGGIVFWFTKGTQPNGEFNTAKYLNQIDQSKFNEARTNLYNDVKTRLEKNPQDWEAVRDLGSLYYYIEDYPAAEEILAQVLKYQPQDIIALQNLATVYQNTQRYGLAEQSLYKILDVNILWMPAYENLAELYRFKLVPANDKYPETINRARELDVEDQYEQTLLKRLAFYYAYNKQTDKALETFAEYVKKYPDDKESKQVYEDLKAGKVID